VENYYNRETSVSGSKPRPLIPWVLGHPDRPSRKRVSSRVSREIHPSGSGFPLPFSRHCEEQTGTHLVCISIFCPAACLPEGRQFPDFGVTSISDPKQFLGPAFNPFGFGTSGSAVKKTG